MSVPHPQHYHTYATIVCSDRAWSRLWRRPQVPPPRPRPQPQPLPTERAGESADSQGLERHRTSTQVARTTPTAAVEEVVAVVALVASMASVTTMTCPVKRCLPPSIPSFLHLCSARHRHSPPSAPAALSGWSTPPPYPSSPPLVPGRLTYVRPRLALMEDAMDPPLLGDNDIPRLRHQQHRLQLLAQGV